MSSESDAWDPQGEAMLDHLEGRRPALVRVHVVGEDEDVHPPELVDAADFFRDAQQMEPWELTALDLCVGKVLDVGAGAGCHALELQARGVEVLAIDRCEGHVEVMRRRGVREAQRARPEDLASGAGSFRTLLLLMHGLGLAGDTDGLRRLLEAADALLEPGGCLLLDSRDPGSACEDAPRAGLSAEGDLGEPGFAVAELQLEYAGRRGASFGWLFGGAAAVARLAAEQGWLTEVVWAEDEGRYLARISRSG